MKTSNFLLKTITVLTLSLFVGTTIYAAVIGPSLPTVNDGDPLTSTAWNDVINEINTSNLPNKIVRQHSDGSIQAAQFCDENGLNCYAPSGVISSESDPQVGALTNTNWCHSDGVQVICDRSIPVITESDPKVSTLTNGKWCSTDGSVVTCTQDAPSSSQWTTSGSDVSFTGGSVGIGAIIPSLPLNVQDANSTSYTGIGITNTDTTSRTWSVFSNSNLTTFGPAKGFGIRDVQAGTTRLVIDTSGNVGIGTLSPSTKLDLETANGTANQIELHQSGIRVWRAGMAASSPDFIIRDESGAVDVLTLDSTQNATFAGKITAQSGQFTSFSAPASGIGAEVFYGGGAATLLGYNRTGSAYVPTAVDGSTVELKINSIAALTLDASKNATFAGDVNVSSSTPLITLTDTDTGADALIDAQSGTGGLIVKVDANNEVGSSYFGLQVDGSEKFRITDTGNVGIGTATPSAKLHVKDERVAAEDVIPFVLDYTYTDTPVGTVSNGIGFSFNGPITSGATYDSGIVAAIVADRDILGGGAPASRGVRSHLSFKTSNNISEGLAERMRINNDGKIGIGTTTPSQILDINGSSPFIEIQATGAAENEGIYFSDSTSAIQGRIKYDTGVHSLEFATNAVTTALTLDASQNAIFAGNVSTNGQIVSPQNTTLTPGATTQTIDWNTSNAQELDLGTATGDVTLTLSNPVAGAAYFIKVVQGATARQLVWPAAVKWPGGTAHTLTTTNDAIDSVTLYFDGTNYLANGSGDYQ